RVIPSARIMAASRWIFPERHPQRLWSQACIHLSDLDDGSDHSLLPLPLVHGSQAKKKRLVAELFVMMRFLGIGIDFGWQGKPSGLAALDWDGHSLSLIEMQNIKPFEEILASVERIASNGQALVAIDAPIIITNDDGMRDADRQMHKLF